MEHRTRDDRIESLDVLRGFALLGILVMNIQSFAMVDAAYMNPMAYGDMTGANYWVWRLSHLFADMKFLTLFSMLFGAGVVLFAERAKAKGQRPAPLHYRRMFWLFVFGMLHAYLLWHGDVLVAYAICGSIVFLFKDMPARRLCVLGLLSISVASLLYLLAQLSLPHWPEDEIASLSDSWWITDEGISKRIKILRGPWIGQLPHRARAALMMQTFLFACFTAWRASGCMLLGMALYRANILNGRRSSRFYWGLATVGLAVGLPIIAYGTWRNFEVDWNIRYSFFLGSQFNYWGSLSVAVGYIAVICLVCRAKIAWLTDSLSAVGRLALTNYLVQSLLCSFIFYGHGLGMYCGLDRVQQIGVVLCVWIVQIAFSLAWTKQFRQGPMEWLWRRLAYGSLRQ